MKPIASVKSLSQRIPESWRKRLRRPKVYIPLSILLLGLIAFIVFRFFFSGGNDAILTGTAQKGTFQVSLTEVGELRAMRSRTVVAPQVDVELTIVTMAPEGSVVKAGDTLATFETTKLMLEIADIKRDLEQSRSNYAKAQAQQEYQNAQLEADRKNAEASYKLAELSLQTMQYEAEIERQKKVLQMEQAQISRDQALQRIESQKLINEAERASLKLSVRQAESRYQKAMDQLKSMALPAPTDGLVVYLRSWRSNRKFRPGDNLWSGQQFIELPDLSEMQVVTQVNEVDVAKVRESLLVEITLDAFPGPVFKGIVSNVANLASDRRDEGRLKTFDVVVDVRDHDSRLRPGMTTRNRIVTAELSDKLSIPIEAVMLREDTTIAYRKSATGWARVPVKTAEQNEIRVCIVGDLKAGDQVALSDPYQRSETQSESTTPSNGKSEKPASFSPPKSAGK